MMGIYATLGVFLIMAVKDPMANESLIWFTVWSSFVHGGIMAVQAPIDPVDRINLFGDLAWVETRRCGLCKRLARGDGRRPETASRTGSI